MKLILGSSSPYRKILLERLRIPFDVVSPNIDERPLENETPDATALRLAQAKAKKIAEIFPNAVIIGCDQVATLNGEQLGKPLSHTNAVAQLLKMQGKTVIFHSALCLYNAQTNKMQAEIVPYEVVFRPLSREQIEAYLNIEKPYDVAGSAKSEGLGIALIERMTGDDPNALVGLPLIKLISMLNAEEISLFD